MKNALHAELKKLVKTYAEYADLPESVKDQLAKINPGLPTIIIFYMGGTLGCIMQEGKLVAAESADELLEDLIRRGIQDDVNIIWFPVFPPIDSTEAHWTHFESVANAIRLLYDRADGFVVAGGTDTMSYCLSSLSFMFPLLGKPIIGVGSQYSTFRVLQDATRNLAFAITAGTSDLSGIHLAFDTNLMLGRATHKVADYRMQAFAAPVQFLTAELADGIQFTGSAVKRAPYISGENLQFSPGFRDGLTVIELTPFTSPNILRLLADDDETDIIGLVTYGAGNVPCHRLLEDRPTFVDVMEEIKPKKPVVLISAMIDGKIYKSPYEGGAEAVERGGAVTPGDTTGPCLRTKVARCIDLAWDETKDNLDRDKFVREMNRSHIGEWTPPKQEAL